MKKLMTHIVAGYPSLKKSEELLRLMAKNGADFIEIQIPFSDPVADGPTIMQANQKSLEAGTKVEDCFELMKKMTKIGSETKFLFMTYFNILHHYGVEKFCSRAAKCGCYGLIVPDMPIDEEAQEHYLKNCRKHGLAPIQIISPLTPERRLKMIAKVAAHPARHGALASAEGFVYCVSRFGTTGQESKLNPQLSSYLKKVKKHIKVPLAVGFGISNKAHVEAVWKEADIAVVGSKIINILNENSGDLKKLEEFVKGLKL
ncbi:tryptophan synthase subunit alpha [Candidatus Peregrinibacteria bacterium]|nr:tryptophan synthase subunit alpha [Candidatus Peregrinibacteria bacterium]